MNNKIYGWITKENPFVVLVSHNEKQVRLNEEEATREATREVVLFEYNGTSIRYPDELTFMHKQEHGNKISTVCSDLAKQGITNLFAHCGVKVV